MGPPTTEVFRQQPGGNEEAAAELRLGEFQAVPTLTLSEARLLINAVLEHRKNAQPVNETETLIKTQDHLETFARFKQKENIEAVEQMLATKVELEYFERSQLGTLCPDSADEAKTLIPSLQHKITDDDLNDLLNDMTKLRNFTEG